MGTLHDQTRHHNIQNSIKKKTKGDAKNGISFCFLISPEKKAGEDIAEEGVRERSVQVESDSSTLLERVVEEERSSPLGKT